jgi:hypothetical protein
VEEQEVPVMGVSDPEITDDVRATFRIDDAARAVQAIHGGWRRSRRERDREFSTRAGARAAAAEPAPSSTS